MTPQRKNLGVPEAKIRDLQDPSWMFNQSGVIPYRHVGGKLCLLLITSRRKKHWVVPKGIIEVDLNAEDSAAQEAFEEAGVLGVIHPDSVGEYTYQKWGGTCRVKIFLMQVQSQQKEWPEDFFRERQWLSIEEAAQRVDQEGLKKLIQKVPEFLRQIKDT
jgi:8-oxo-dGTP pyrophosphatase MutT (NUDIX family)